MLKQCYYLDQTNFTPTDYRYLSRYIERMIQYRNTTKGSYDGKNRIEELKSLDVDRLSDNTKRILVYWINRYHLNEELMSEEPLSALSDVDFEEIDTLLNGRKGTMKLTINEFISNLKELNQRIEACIASGELPKDYRFDIKCIGGFAMLYHGIRANAVTEDMDSLVAIDRIVKDAIQSVAVQNALSYDWINDAMLSFYTEEQFHWTEVPFFDRRFRIRVFVCSKEDLLKTKAGLAENYLNGKRNQDRDGKIDLDDTVEILGTYGVYTNAANAAFNRFRLEGVGIDKKTYEKLYGLFVDDDDVDEETYYVLKKLDELNRCETDIDTFWKILQDDFGLTKEAFQSAYSGYCDYFPEAKEAFNHDDNY